MEKLSLVCINMEAALIEESLISFGQGGLLNPIPGQSPPNQAGNTSQEVADRKPRFACCMTMCSPINANMLEKVDDQRREATHCFLWTIPPVLKCYRMNHIQITVLRGGRRELP